MLSCFSCCCFLFVLFLLLPSVVRYLTLHQQGHVFVMVNVICDSPGLFLFLFRCLITPNQKPIHSRSCKQSSSIHHTHNKQAHIVICNPLCALACEKQYKLPTKAKQGLKNEHKHVRGHKIEHLFVFSLEK